MATKTPYQWHWKHIVILHFMSVFLLWTWFGSDFRPYWDSLDAQFFYFFNSWVKISPFWQQFWAYANTHHGDGAVALWMFLLSICPAIVFEKGEHLRQAFRVAVLMLGVLAIRWIASLLLDVGRNSPSLVLQPFYSLAESVPLVEAKISSTRSFPGDHDAVLFAWSFYLLTNIRQTKWRLVCIATTLALLLPRFVSGAHWMTDALVGGLAVSMICIAWLIFSPYLDRLEQFATAIINRVRWIFLDKKTSKC